MPLYPPPSGGTSIPDPLTVSTLQGGTASTSTLLVRATSAVAAAGADIIFKIGTAFGGFQEPVRLQQDDRIVVQTRYTVAFKRTNGAVIDTFYYNEGLSPERVFCAIPLQVNDKLFVSGIVTGSADMFAGTTNYLGWASSSAMWAPAAGQIVLANPSGSFSRLMFGSTSSSFPALKMVGAGLEFRLADDSGLTFASVDHVLFTERSDPGNAGTNQARLYSRDNGSGKTQLCVVFQSGAVQVLATEP